MKTPSHILNHLVLFLSAIFVICGCNSIQKESSIIIPTRLWHLSNKDINGEVLDAKYDRQAKQTMVYLKTPDGQTQTIPFRQFSKEDREYAWYDVNTRRGYKDVSFPGSVTFTDETLTPVDVNIPYTMTISDKEVLLGIDARTNAFDHPPEGWCGEVAIQEALMFYGAYYPQSHINEAGNPKHPDLYSNELPIALTNIGMQIERWTRQKTAMPKFIGWVRKQINNGLPVLSGVKIYPTKHKEWSLDHFILITGFKGDSIVLNTTWGYKETLSNRQMRSKQKGFSFANRYDSYYGISIKGWKLPSSNSFPVRLFSQKETVNQMAVIIKCEELEPGVEYSLYKLSSPDEKIKKPIITFKAERTVHAFQDTFSKNTPVIYRCQESNITF